MNPVQGFIQPELVAQVGFAAVVTLTFTGALIAVFPRNILYNVLGLIVCLTGVAGLFLYLGSPFIALMQLLIYVGAICISIIFAIMLSRPLHLSLPSRRLPKVGLALGVGLVVFTMLIGIVYRTAWQPAAIRSSDWSVTTLGTYLLTRYDLVFEAISLVLLVAILGAIIISGYARRRPS
ncbi:MAG: NADH-quinone oxidoreductase subunit J [Deltaproteobacteria bacterium]|nr:MAG: NADH-quinone oxidoreductase subunit J [Deltaproteobacteria bacterium]